MRILIIGSKGFIGSNLADYLKSIHTIYKADVVADYIDNNYTIINQSSIDFNILFRENNFDVCINCSGAADVNVSFSNTTRDFLLNTVNVFYILEAIKQHQPTCKFINLSSAAVYGNPNELPISENSTTQPISPYGYHKQSAELLCKEYYELFNISNCSLRIFSAYGNGLSKQLFWDIYQKSITANTITLFGNGNESRDFIHIIDICKAIELIIKNCDFKSNIINIANGEEVAIIDVVKLYLDILDWKGELLLDNITRYGNPTNWRADIAVLNSFGYKKSVSLGFGLEMYAKWIRDLR